MKSDYAALVFLAACCWEELRMVPMRGPLHIVPEIR